MHKNFIHALLIAAFVLAGISPACNFIGGKAFAMEICKSDGTLATLVMNEDGSVTEKEKEDTRAGTDCAFCFTAQHIKTLNAVDLKPSVSPYQSQNGILANSAAIARKNSAYLYAPRGPPVPVV